MFLQLSSYFAYSFHSSLLIFVSAASFAASFYIPIQKVSFLHFILIYAGILPHLTEKKDLFLHSV